MMQEFHVPVLFNESIKYLINNRHGIYFDATAGFGGHSAGFLNVLESDARLIATEVDSTAVNFYKQKFADDTRVVLYNANFSQIDTISKIEFIDGFDGIFADLGVSSFQLDDSEAGFTYRNESLLDLRLDKTRAETGAYVVNTFQEEDLADLIFKYGEEKNSRRIARKIAERRTLKKIVTTKDLSAIIEEITPPHYVNKTLSGVFQALRIYVNDELGELKEFLTKAVNLLVPGGSIVILTYHSLEDRIVKELFKYESLACVCPPGFPVCVCEKQQRLELLTRKAVSPSAEELAVNRRARSAKLRAAKKI